MVINPKTATRGECIAWLQWNDRNGCYSDADCDAEEIARLTDDNARLMVADMMLENEIDDADVMLENAELELKYGKRFVDARNVRAAFLVRP